jgi:hypothetical protein
LILIACFPIVLFSGCEPSTPPSDKTNATTDQSAKNSSSSHQGAANKLTSTEQGSDADVATRAELDEYAAAFTKNAIWHYGERTAGELIGIWESVDGDEHRIVFGADGHFSEQFNADMTTGLYAISDSGQIITFSKSNGVGLGSRFQLDGKSITGPKGPKPNARWERTQPKE